MQAKNVITKGLLTCLFLLLSASVGLGQASGPALQVAVGSSLPDHGPPSQDGTLTAARGPRERKPLAAGQTANGADPISGRFPISPVRSSPTETGEMNSAVAYSNGSMRAYMVVWQQPTADYSGSVIFLQSVSDNGTLAEIWGPVSPATGENQNPDVAYNSTLGQFLVVWEMGGQRIDGQVLTNTGSRVGPVRTLAEAFGANTCVHPKVIYSPAVSQYLLVWQQASASDAQILARPVAADGVVSPGLLLFVSDRLTSALPSEPVVAYDANIDQALIVWQEWASDMGQHDIRGRAMSMTMAGGIYLVGPSIAIFSSADDETMPAVAALSTPASVGGRYLVAAQRMYYGTTPMIDGYRLNGYDLSLDLWFPLSPEIGVAPALAGSEGSREFLAASILDASTVQASTVPADGVGTTYGMLAGVNPTRPAVAAGFGGDFLVAFDDSYEPGAVYDVFGWLWGNRLFLPAIFRHD